MVTNRCQQFEQGARVPAAATKCKIFDCSVDPVSKIQCEDVDAGNLMYGYGFVSAGGTARIRTRGLAWCGSRLVAVALHVIGARSSMPARLATL